jgi:uncharacterized membrane protein
MQYASVGIFVMACLVFGVNIIVEVIKKALPKVPSTYVAIGVSVVLTMGAFFGWVSWKNLTLRWYCVAAAFVFGIFVAYAAMFGFDKFKDALKKLKNYKK